MAGSLEILLQENLTTDRHAIHSESAARTQLSCVAEESEGPSVSVAQQTENRPEVSAGVDEVFHVSLPGAVFSAETTLPPRDFNNPDGVNTTSSHNHPFLSVN